MSLSSSKGRSLISIILRWWPINLIQVLGVHALFIYPQAIRDVQQSILFVRMSSDISLDAAIVV